MSVFVQQQGTYCDFTGGDSWVILSPIEQSIKRKIEAVGTPLKDWDINIYRGVLTGYNEAFIIPSEKRDEILRNCKTEEERKKTEELIRPILRGRDIKRYGYEWAGLYLIATFPARHYDIEKFPAVKQYLLSFAYDYLIENGNKWVAENHLAEYCKKKLAQTGQYVVINGKYITDDKGNKEKGRKKTSNKWFETQDSISYWEDFIQPKIVYPNMTKYMPFCFDDKGYLTNQKCFIITGERIAFLTAFLNSSIFKYCFRDSFPELQGGTRELSKIFFDSIPVLKVSIEQERVFEAAVLDIQSNYTETKARALDRLIFDAYHLNEEDMATIGYVEIT